MNIRKLERIAYAPYDTIQNPTREDWQKSYDALVQLAAEKPEDGRYPNTLGYLCYYGRHTGQRDYTEARKWFEKGNDLHMIESAYKLSDMLAEGMGGPVDGQRALHLRLLVYFYCRDEFESGKRDGKFADTALRMGRMFHEGKIVPKNDLEAIGYLLEAKYAIDCRKQYHEYGDSTVEKHIRRVMDECEKPDEKVRNMEQYGMRMDRVPEHIQPGDGVLMTVRIDADDMGILRLEFRRKRADGKKPNRILWSVAPAMKCFMTDSIVLYGADVREIWNKNPGELVVCDRYENDEENGTYLFYLEDELQCRLRGGRYVLPMDEFWMTELRDHPETDSDISQ